MTSWRNTVNKDKSHVSRLSHKNEPGDRMAEEIANRERELERLEKMQRRPAIIHWLAFALSIVSLGILAYWMVISPASVPFAWFILDVVLSGLFVVEFVSRSGFITNPIGYMYTRFFDFIAMVPVLALVSHGYPGEPIWVWLILVARSARFIDRLLGDGFVRRNVLALVEGFEEEITDRVLIRIIERIQTDMERGKFGERIGTVLEQNKSKILDRITEETRIEGIGEGVAHLVGLDRAIQRVEERTFNSIINILQSTEVDRTIRESVGTVFESMRHEIGVKTWMKHLGIRSGPLNSHRRKRTS